MNDAKMHVPIFAWQLMTCVELGVTVCMLIGAEHWGQGECDQSQVRLRL